MSSPSWIRYSAVLYLACIATAYGADAPSSEEMAIRANVRAYVHAYEHRDAKALAALWSPKAIYVNPSTGKRCQGREAIEKEFAAQFKKAGPNKLRVEVQAIRFVTPDVAVEDGSAKVIDDGGDATESTYTAVHVKQDGKWLLDSIRETETPVSTSNYDNLKELEWMIGRWSDSDENATIETNCQWTANKNFITRSFKVIVEGRIDVEGTQVIGWDAKRKHIRSWVFDSDGGFSEGTWRREGDRWVVAQSGYLRDGRSVAATNIMKRIDDNTSTWQSIGRTLDGAILPNVDETTVIRQSEDNED